MELIKKPQNLKTVRDQLGREISISFPPQRIISIVPSQTEFLFDLGLDQEITGVTKFCIHPEEKVKLKTKVGGTKNLNLKKIHSLQPDLIIANKEENEEEHVKTLMKDYPVWISDIKTPDDAYEMMERVGEMVNRGEEAQFLLTKIKSAFDDFQRNSNEEIQNPLNTAGWMKPAVYLIWYRPFMTIGSDTFINHMLSIAGFKNVFADRNRYPEITIEELGERKATYILLSSEPYPFKQKHIDELSAYFPSSKIFLVDGEMFSWYGSRLLKAPDYFMELNDRVRRM